MNIEAYTKEYIEFIVNIDDHKCCILFHSEYIGQRIKQYTVASTMGLIHYFNSEKTMIYRRNPDII